MYHTTNDTTQTVGTATATVICDSRSPAGKRITTFELVYPRFIHSELMTHRMFSRNAASSRATPTRVLLKEVEENPVMPAVWRKNRPGMSGGEEFDEHYSAYFRGLWDKAAQRARIAAASMAHMGLAKETVNRLLEPFLRIRTLVTATEWDNFFLLRRDKAHVQPEMYELATAMWDALMKSKPVKRHYHLPYMEEDLPGKALSTPSREYTLASAARCARVSYLTHEGAETTMLKDQKLAGQLLRNRHLSPFEHIAIALNDPDEARFNLRGWQSFRYGIERGGELHA